MKCVSCGDKTEIIDTEKYDTVVWRKRRCMTCNARMNTHEVVVKNTQNWRSQPRVENPKPRKAPAPKPPRVAAPVAEKRVVKPVEKTKPTRQRIQDLRDSFENRLLEDEFSEA